MAAPNTAIRITELDFDNIRDNIKEFLRDQDEFTDFDFEGSGMAVLLDTLAINTYYGGFYLSMVANESFLDTAQERNSVLSLAKLTNYIPQSMQGAVAVVDLQVTPTSGSEPLIHNTCTLERFTRLLGRDIDGINYPFVVTNANTAVKVSGSFFFSNVIIKQGEVNTLQYTMLPGNTKRRFNIPSRSVDANTIILQVQDSAANTTLTEYTLNQDITELTGNSTVFFIEEDENLTYTFYFGDNILGKKPQNGSVITVTYLDTSGPDANAISDFVFTDAIAGLYRSNVSITTVEGSRGGVDKETVEQIRFRAPYFYTAQNRAVTKYDYESLLLRDFNNIEAISVWGGEENDPVVYGKVFISMKTRENYELTNLEKENIKDQLIRTRNIMTVTPEIVDPNYIYVIVKGKVTYNPTRTSLTAEQIKSYVRAAILDYKTNELDRFNSTFRKSRLLNYIDTAQEAITSSDIDIFLQKRVDLLVEEQNNYKIKFDARIRRGSLSEKLYSYPDITVLDGAAVERQVFFEEDMDSLTGIDSIEVVTPGSNYEAKPVITITGDGVGAEAEAVVIGGRINSITMTNRGNNYSYATVTVVGGFGQDATAIARLQQRYGVLRSYYYKTSGEKFILNASAATIDYELGIVEFTSLLPMAVRENNFYDDDVFTLNVPSEDDIIYPLRNRIISLDDTDAASIQIDVVAEV
jgi:hypothetical protein